MSTSIFKKIYESSKLLATPTSAQPLPALKRDMAQIEKETEYMSKRIKPNPQLHAQAHYFLAQGGINSQELAQNLNVIDNMSVTPRPEFISNTNVEEYHDQMHEIDVINTIEEIRQQTDDYVDGLEDKIFQSDMDQIQKSIKEVEELAKSKKALNTDPYTQYLNLAPNSKIHAQLEDQMTDYAKVVMATNDMRLKNKDYPIIKAFKEVVVNKPSTEMETTISKNGLVERKDYRVVSMWQLLDKLVGESDADLDDRLQGRYIKTFLVPSYDSQESLESRRHLIQCSKAWLEDQSIQYMDDVLLKNAHEAKPGGNPSFILRLQSFLKLTFKKNSQWTDDRLEIVDDLPVWTFIFMALRSGQDELALEFIQHHPTLYRSEEQFVDYLKEYLSNPDRCLCKETRDKVMADYQRLEYSERNADPYKVILIKILGRCELNKKNCPDVIKTTEDYLWLQLTLIRENLDEHDFWHEKYTLQDLQQLMTTFGAKRFDPTGSTPWTYFKVLVATLQFEHAINYLYKNEQSRLQAIHFAIAMMYYGLLRIPNEPLRSSFDLLIMEGTKKDIATLNFTRMIYQYLHHNVSLKTDTKKYTQQRFFFLNDKNSNQQQQHQQQQQQQQQPYIQQHPRNSLHYLLLLPLYSTQDGYYNDNMVTLARSYVRDLILSTDDYKSLLGSSSPEKGRLPGYMDQYKALLGLGNEQDYVKYLLHPLAENYVERGKYVEAVYDYELSGDYNVVVDILNQQLTSALRRQTYTLTEGNMMTIPDMIQFTVSTLNHYEQHQHIIEMIHESKKITVLVLVQFVKGKEFYDQGDYDKALQVIGQTGVIPIGDGSQLLQVVDQFEKLDTSICNSMPDVLLMVMDMLYKTWQEFKNSDDELRPMIQQTLSNLEQKVRTLLVFVGMIRLKIPADTIIKLNKVEMMMMERKS
ncbi:Nup93/Nic96-domain-containing protein [Halteromyces radiatus]|uniref:Nup93/Nic96-domain-containing protein n=1 Tax=Halteromyces radiatus TaxID=101107 RepID=UPI00221FF047|nr:Nup93/Nic96-domain-containing protein [Halteromyces radiatus]KAI8097148.1 Nup93/Nic96-domain-containing protein [Halteromyces radiatus]